MPEQHRSCLSSNHPGQTDRKAVTLHPDLSTHLFKLMDSKDATGVTAMGAYLLAKTGGQASILDGQILGPQPLVPVESGNGLL